MLRSHFFKTLARFKPRSFQKLFYLPSVYFTTSPGKRILNVWELKPHLYLELSDALSAASSCRLLAELLKENIHQMTDYQLSYAIYRIWQYDLELDDNFYNIILPIVKEFIKLMNREHNKSLAEIIQYMGWMKIDDEDLWKLLDYKLVNEKLYRYIPLKELCKCAEAIAFAGRGSPELFNAFERVLIKHRLSLEEEDIENAKKAFSSRPDSNQLLLDVLADPQRELPEGAVFETKKLAQKKKKQLQKKGKIYFIMDSLMSILVKNLFG